MKSWILVFSAVFGALSAHSASPGMAESGDAAVLTRMAVSQAHSAAAAQGVGPGLTVEAMDGLRLALMYDTKALNSQEALALAEFDGRPLRVLPSYLVVKAEKGGGCIAAPVWSERSQGKRGPLAIGITDMRCSKSQVGFERLLKVALVAMDM